MLGLSSHSFLALLGFAGAALAGRAVIHDASFQPDIILRADKVNQTVACVYRKSVAINGTVPGPLVTLKEGKTTWIRVYNDMRNTNLTIVSFTPMLPQRIGSNRMSTALAWLEPERRSIQV